jgi:uncharacterized protein (TIGR00369 family)
MGEASTVRLSTPQEVREFPLGRFELFRIGDAQIGQATYEPGWRWSKHVAPRAGTVLCEVEHLGLVISGRAGVKMADGTELTLEPGHLFYLPAGHDSWVIGDEPYVSLHLLGAERYAQGHQESKLNFETASALMREIGLRFDTLTPTLVTGSIDTGARHHHPWNSVHGGLFSTAIETAATTGAYLHAIKSGSLAVGVTNITDFVRPLKAGRVGVRAEPIHQGGHQQLWEVVITSQADEKLIAHGQVRLQHVEPHAK